MKPNIDNIQPKNTKPKEEVSSLARMISFSISKLKETIPKETKCVSLLQACILITLCSTCVALLLIFDGVRKKTQSIDELHQKIKEVEKLMDIKIPDGTELEGNNDHDSGRRKRSVSQDRKNITQESAISRYMSVDTQV